MIIRIYVAGRRNVTQALSRMAARNVAVPTLDCGEGREKKYDIGDVEKYKDADPDYYTEKFSLYFQPKERRNLEKKIYFGFHCRSRATRSCELAPGAFGVFLDRRFHGSVVLLENLSTELLLSFLGAVACAKKKITVLVVKE